MAEVPRGSMMNQGNRPSGRAVVDLSSEAALAAQAQGRYHFAIQEALKLLLESGHAPGWRRVRSSKSALVAQTTSGPAFFVKIFFPRRWYEGIKTALRGDRAYRSDRRTQALHAAGFSAPAVVLRGRVNHLPFSVTEAAPGISLAAYLNGVRSGPASPGVVRQQRDTLTSLGAEVGRLHHAGFFHTELRTSNVYVHLRPDGTARFTFLDNEGTRRFTRLPWRRRVKNLAQLNMDHPHLTRTDRMRVLTAYLAATGLQAERRRLVRDVIARTERRLQENAQSAGKDPTRVTLAVVPHPSDAQRSTEALQTIPSVQRR